MWENAITLRDKISSNIHSDNVANDFIEYDDQFTELMNNSRKFTGEVDRKIREWHYYDRQIVYLLGPEVAVHTTLIWNTLSDLKNDFNRWVKIKNKENPSVQELLYCPKNRFDDSIKHFRAWYKGGEQRLILFKDALQ